METEVKNRIIKSIEVLETAPGLSGMDAERILMEILTPLLAEEDYTVQQFGVRGSSETGLDLIAKRPQTAQFQSNTIGILQKHYKSAVPVDVVRELIGASVLQNLDRALLITNTSFTRSAYEIVKKDLPVQLELIDIDVLKHWVHRIGIDKKTNLSEITLLLKTLSRAFATLIADNPRKLDELEWRDMERMLAEVFEGIGFSVQLTPSSKDGGKDVILECVVGGIKRTYIVEIKHWRSGNRVGTSSIKDFLNVIISEKREGGLFLSTYGYCDNSIESLSEIERQQLKFGNEEKIVSLCKTYLKSGSSIWSPPENLTEILLEKTL